MLRLGGHLVSSRDFANAQAVFGLLVFGDQSVEELFHLVDWLRDGGRNLLERQRLVCDVDDGFESRHELLCERDVFNFDLFRSSLLRLLYFEFFHLLVILFDGRQG